MLWRSFLLLLQLHACLHSPLHTLYIEDLLRLRAVPPNAFRKAPRGVEVDLVGNVHARGVHRRVRRVPGRDPDLAERPARRAQGQACFGTSLRSTTLPPCETDARVL